MPPPAPDLDTLLAHADWLGRLVRQLSRDVHAADDATQDTLLASLLHPPQQKTNLRGFFAAVARNVLRQQRRSDVRRGHREARAVIEGAAESAADTVARAELQQRLGTFVLELPEPQRALVLRHYFDGEMVETIALRHRWSSDAVHGHLRRARETLRERLQRGEHSRRGTLAPIGLLLFTMTTKMKIAAAGSAVAAAGLLLWTWPSFGPPPTITGSHPVVDAAPATAELAASEAADAQREEAQPAVGSPPPPTPSGATPGRLLGRVVDGAGTPVVPARVYVLPLRDGEATDEFVVQDEVDAEGRFEVDATYDGDVLVVGIPLQASMDDPKVAARPLALRRELIAAPAHATTDRRRTIEIADVVLPASVSITGTVRAAGEAVPNMRVGWYPQETGWDVVLDDFVITRTTGGVHVDVTTRSGGSTFNGATPTNAAGEFTIATAAGLTGYVFLQNQSGQGQIERLVVERTVTAPTTVAFDLLEPACVRIVADGKPVPHAIATLTFDIGGTVAIENYRADADGEVRVHRERYAPIRGRIRRPGRAALAFAVPDDATPASPLVVDIGIEPVVAIQVAVTGDFPVRTAQGSVWRLGVDDPAPISLTPEAGANGVTLRGNAPPGEYRLSVASARDATGNDAFVLRRTVDITIVDGGAPIAVHVKHGGRMRVTVNTTDGRHARGTIRLVDAAGTETKPSMHSPGTGNGEPGAMWMPGTLWTAQSLSPGRYEVIVDHGARGTHRQFVDVRACEFADVTVIVR